MARNEASKGLDISDEIGEKPPNALLRPEPVPFHKKWMNVLEPNPHIAIPSVNGKPPKCCDLCPADFRPQPQKQAKYLGIERRVWDSEYASGDGMAKEDAETGKDDSESASEPSFLQVDDSDYTKSHKKGGKGGNTGGKKSSEGDKKKSDKGGKKATDKSGKSSKGKKKVSSKVGNKKTGKPGKGGADPSTVQQCPTYKVKKLTCPRIKVAVSKVTLKPCCNLCPSSSYAKVDFDDNDVISFIEADMKTKVGELRRTTSFVEVMEKNSKTLLVKM